MSGAEESDTLHPALLDVHQGVYAFDKPSGFKTHPGTGGGPDMVSWIDAHPDLPPGLAPVHRLDVGTSGVLLCAAEDLVKRSLHDAIEKGELHKAYVALVHGRMRNKGVIRAPLVDGGTRREATTRWRRLERFGPFSYISVKPAEGRRHQIRRHLAGLGHPVVGDTRHRPPNGRPVPGAPPRLWLHARGITWGDWQVSAPLPDELEAHLAFLREEFGSDRDD